MPEKQPQPQKTAKKKKHRSLRESLIVLIFLCWVLPVLLTAVLSSVLQARNNSVHVADIVDSSIQNAAGNLQRDLDSVVSESLTISYVLTVRNAYTQYLEDGNYVDLFIASRSFLDQQYSRSRLISSVHLLFPGVSHPSDVLCYTYNATNYNAGRALNFYNTAAPQKATAVMGTLGSNIGFFEDDGLLYMVRVMSLQGNVFKPYAVMVVEINQDALFEGPQSLPWLTNMSVFINDVSLSVTGEPVDAANYAPALPQVQTEKPNSRTLMVYAAPTGSRFSFQYYAEADLSFLINEFSGSVALIAILAVLSVPLMAIVLSFFLRKVSRPINTLSGLAGEIDAGKFGTQIEAEALGSKEFVYLGTQLNAMSARLKDQFERLYREELALRDARIKALQSQINPHFLGNTLEIINWEARLAGNVKVSAMMEALSTMLEAALDRRRKPLVHLSEEMMYVNAYLYIISERLGKRLEVKQEIDDSLLDWFVPRLILQPIVENAVEHGVTQRQRGVITIRAVQISEDWMRLEVENDAPMQPGDMERVNNILNSENEPEGESSGNIGIRNVHQRLRILYGPQSGLVMGNNASHHTVGSMLIGRHTPEKEGEPEEGLHESSNGNPAPTAPQ